MCTVSNLLENGRYPAETLAWIFETQKKGLQLAFEKDVVLAAGSDAGRIRRTSRKRNPGRRECNDEKSVGARKWAGARKSGLVVWKKKRVPGKVLVKFSAFQVFRKI